jgi:hypothetical protein
MFRVLIIFAAAVVALAVVSASPASARSCTLTMYSTDGTATAKYYLENAWPSKVEIGP